MKVPEKILTRKDEITREFLSILDTHINDILQGKINYMYHIKDFASLLFIHPTHFSNTIKLATGKSPCDFVEERTIASTKKMCREMETAESFNKAMNQVASYRLQERNLILMDADNKEVLAFLKGD